MDDTQFREVLKLHDEHNKAMLNTFLSGISQIVTAISPSSRDHDLLIEIKTILTSTKNDLDTHLVESIPIRDMVKRNNVHVELCEKDEHCKKLDKCYDFVNKAWWIIGVMVTAIIGSIVTMFKIR